MPDTAIGAPFAEDDKSPTRPVIRFMSYPEKLRSIARQYDGWKRVSERYALRQMSSVLHALAREAASEELSMFIEETRI